MRKKEILKQIALCIGIVFSVCGENNAYDSGVNYFSTNGDLMQNSG